MAKAEGKILKSDSSELDRRINTVYLLVLQGFVRKQIIQYAAENWEVGERQVDTYLAKARELYKKNASEDFEGKKHEILTQYYDLYRKNYELEDYKECKGVLKEIAAVLGIEAPKKLDMTSGGDKLIDNRPIINFIDGSKPT
jgi:hypothetical protein